jgi:hypothetical protein
VEFELSPLDSFAMSPLELYVVAAVSSKNHLGCQAFEPPNAVTFQQTPLSASFPLSLVSAHYQWKERLGCRQEFEQ